MPSSKSNLFGRSASGVALMIALKLLLPSCSSAATNAVPPQPVHVSIIQLISNPATYEGKLVRVVGFLKLQFEGNAIYLHEDDWKHFITKNGIWVDPTRAVREKQASLDKKYVVLEGIFTASRKGHMGLWSGSLANVSQAYECIDVAALSQPQGGSAMPKSNLESSTTNSLPNERTTGNIVSPQALPKRP